MYSDNNGTPTDRTSNRGSHVDRHNDRRGRTKIQMNVVVVMLIVMLSRNPAAALLPGRCEIHFGRGSICLQIEPLALRI